MMRPAFPPLSMRKFDSFGDPVPIGMSLREWYATHAPISMKEAWTIWTDHKKRPLSHISSDNERIRFFEWFASLRFEYADAMLKESAGED